MLMRYDLLLALVWGLTPMLAASLGFWLPALVVERALLSPWGQSRLLPRRGGRWPAVEQDRAAVASLAEQWRWARSVLLGPRALLNVALGGAVLTNLIRAPTSMWPSCASWALGTCVLALLADLGLYVTHRLSHTVPILWKIHSSHHRVLTPSSVTGLFIDHADAAVQGVSVLLASLIVQPHPLTLGTYIILRTVDSVANHSGLDSRLFDALTLKMLPGRASVAHHDVHHLYSNRADAAAKNFGENFWLWDWAFGTLSTLQPR